MGKLRNRLRSRAAQSSNLTPLTLLHSNDIHGDFLADVLKNGILLGSLCVPGLKVCGEVLVKSVGTLLQHYFPASVQGFQCGQEGFPFDIYL